MTPVVTWTTLSDSPQPLFWMRKKIRSTYQVCLLVRRTVMNCVLSAKGVFEKVQWVRRERRSVEQFGALGLAWSTPTSVNIVDWHSYVQFPGSILFNSLEKMEGKMRRPNMSTTNRIVKACHKIGRLVCFSPSMGDFQIFETCEYFLDLMKNLSCGLWDLESRPCLTLGNPNQSKSSDTPFQLLFEYLGRWKRARLRVWSCS